MRKMLLAATALAAIALTPAHAETEFKATLVGQVVVPAASFISPPETAPANLRISGKFAGKDPVRISGVGTVMGMDGLRETGLKLPFEGQPLQGFSGIKRMEDGSYWTLSDNGFGAKANSPDAALMLHHIGLDFDGSKFERLETVFLADPDGKVPFRIVHEGTKERFLTGADFDIESIQPVADGFWVGDEFGPYLVHVDRSGRVLSVHDTIVNGKVVRSPDNPLLALPGTVDGKMPAFDIKRSGGFEGMALSKDGGKLYGLMEGPMWDAAASKAETIDGRTVLTIAEFDIASQKWTGRTWKYPLDPKGAAIGDFNMVDATTALVIERDNGAGEASGACPDPKAPKPDCFAQASVLKRIYKVEISDANAGGVARKIGYIDLMNIADPNGKAKQGATNGVYTMPFVTIENVDVVDATHIVVGNDNNLPFSAGRALSKADDNEFVLLEVKDFLAAK